jgi:hypothetical protein
MSGADAVTSMSSGRTRTVMPGTDRLGMLKKQWIRRAKFVVVWRFVAGRTSAQGIAPRKNTPAT